MKKLLLFLCTFLCSVGMWADTETLTLSTEDGIAELSVINQGSNQTVNGVQGGNVELSKGVVTTTASLGYFKGSGSDGIQVYKNGSMTVSVPSTYEISSIVITLASSCYPFAESSDNSLTLSKGKTSSQQDATYTVSPATQSVTFTNNSAGQTKVKKIVVTYTVVGGSNPGGDSGDSGDDTGDSGNNNGETVAFVLEYGGKMLATGVTISSSKAPAIEVEVEDGKVIVDTQEEANAISWILSESNTKGQFTISPKTNSGKYLSAASNSANLSISDTKCLWNGKNDNTFWIPKSDGTEDYYRTITYQEGSTKAFKAYTASNIGASGYASSAAIAMPIVVRKKISITTADNDFYSLFLDYAVTIPSNVTAYKGQLSGNTLQLTEIEGGVIPANTGVVFKTDAAGTATFVQTADVAALENNDIKGVATETAISSIDAGVGNTVLVLGMVDGHVGFAKPATDATNLAANKAYIISPATLAKVRISLGEATAIKTVEKTANNAVRYNLAGQRVNANAKGIVIVNGKKVLEPLSR